MKIAVFDYAITQKNPIGSCHLRILQALSREHEFTVFASEFENPDPSRIRWIRIPAIRRPMVLLFITFHLTAPIFYWAYRLFHLEKFDLVQIDGCTVLLGDLAYAHFCNRSYMKYHWQDSAGKGPRRILTSLAHRLHILAEPWVFRHVNSIVVPSRGLARELLSEYEVPSGKIQILHNAVDIERMKAPANFDRARQRQELGITPDDLEIIFVGLGHFERKGLPQLLEGLTLLDSSNLKLVVVGGLPYLVAQYEEIARQMNLASQVRFVGMKEDVRPYLWSADVFALPSFYEVFPLVVLEAAAAGLPILATQLNGVEEFLVDGQNGFQVDRTSVGIARGIDKFQALSAEIRKNMGEHARRSIRRFSSSDFVQQWRKIYAENEAQ